MKKRRTTTTKNSLPLYIINQIQNCTRCEISQFCDHKVILESNSDNPELLFVGEAPGESEYICKTPFIGRCGEVLKEIIQEAAPERTYAITNAVLCTPFTSSSRSEIRTPFPSEIKECQRFLQRIVARLKPTYIIAVGTIASRSLKGLGLPHCPISHPGAILRAKNHATLETNRAILKIKEYIR